MRWRWAAKVVPLQVFPFILSETRGSNFVGRQRSMGLEFYHQQYWGILVFGFDVLRQDLK